MARKRRKLAGLEYDSPEYWNRLLAMDGLSLSAGLDRHIVYVGTSGNLDKTQEEQSERDTGRVPPKPRNK